MKRFEDILAYLMWNAKRNHELEERRNPSPPEVERFDLDKEISELDEEMEETIDRQRYLRSTMFGEAEVNDLQGVTDVSPNEKIVAIEQKVGILESHIERAMEQIKLHEELENYLWNKGAPKEVVKAVPKLALMWHQDVGFKERWVDNLIEKCNQIEREEEEPIVETEEEIPWHWAQAKTYWDWILEWVNTSSHKVSRKALVRVWEKVEKAKNAKSISSWHYFSILSVLALRLDKPFEVLRLAAYAERCARIWRNRGWTWGPDHSKDEAKAEAAKVPGVQLYEEELMSEYLSWDENDLIDAIDKRAGR